MAANILPPANMWDLASLIEKEAFSLNAGIRLMYDQLQVGQDDSEKMAAALSNMYFITEALGDVEARLKALSAAAYELNNAAKSPPLSF